MGTPKSKTTFKMDQGKSFSLPMRLMAVWRYGFRGDGDEKRVCCLKSKKRRS